MEDCKDRKGRYIKGNRKGKTYEEIYGIERATSEREKRIQGMKQGYLNGRKRLTYWKGKTFSKKAKENMSKAHIGQKSCRKGKKYPQFSGKNHPMFGKHHTKEAKKKMEKTQFKKGRIPLNKGKTYEEIYGVNKTKEIKKKVSETKKRLYEEGKIKVWCEGTKGIMKSHRKGITFEEEFGEKRAKVIKQKIRDARKRQIFPRCKTKPEMKFQKICKNYNLPYEYTGDSKFWIEHVNPDFINCNGEKTCVEIFGDYWHNIPRGVERDKRNLKTLQKYGWKRIIIWEHEVNDEQKVLSILRGEKNG